MISQSNQNSSASSVPLWFNKKHTRTRSGEEGVALIVTLVIVVLLTVLIFEFSYDTQVEASFAVNSSDDFLAYMAAKSAVAQALGVLTEDAFAQYLTDNPSRGGSNGRNSSNRNNPGSMPVQGIDSVMEPWYTEGVPIGQVNESTMRATIQDEYGKINLNALFDMNARLENPDAEPVLNEAAVRTLMNFFIIYDAESEFEVPPEELVAAILDWIDEDDDYTDYVGAEGAESDYYEQSEIPYPAKNGPMDSIEELLLIRGFTPEVFWGDPEKEQLPLTEYLTVHGDPDGRINLNTAHPYVLDAAAVALSEDPTAQLEVASEFGQTIVALRASDGGIMQVTDLESNQLVTSIADPDQPPFDPNDPNPVADNTRQVLESRFGVTGDTYRIFGDAVAEKTKVRIEAYVYRNPYFFGQIEGPTQGDTQSGQVQNEYGLAIPEEPFRILEWKVIR